MTSPSESSFRALVCASDRSLRVLFSDAFKAMGFQVHPTDNPSELSRYAQVRPFELVVLDYLVADTAAVDLARDLRQNGIAAPILITTSLPDEPALGLTDPFIQVLRKPFTMAELRESARGLCPKLQLSPEFPRTAPDT